MKNSSRRLPTKIPRFVEDMVREATMKLSSIDSITWFSVEAENYESIHKHSAYAAVEQDKRGDVPASAISAEHSC